MILPELTFFRLKFTFSSITERRHFFDFVKQCMRSLSDDGTDVFIKRELLKLILKLARRLENKSLILTINWYEYQAIKYVFELFEIPDYQILARVAYGKIDQALPLGFTMSNS